VFDSTVKANYVMIADATETSGNVPAIDVSSGEISAFFSGAAMNYYFHV